MKTIDVRFSIKGTFEDYPTYKGYKGSIERHGSIILTDANINDENNTASVYNPSLFIFLTEKDIPVINLKTNEETTINGTDYLKTYIQGFNEGTQYFNREYANPEKYIDDIHFNYFHAIQPEGLIGWQDIKNFRPTLNNEFIKIIGYYSGIVSEVRRVIKKYPMTFQNFDNYKKEVLKKELPEVKFAIEGINIPSLVNSLQQHHYHYFDESYYDSVLNWFNGVPPESPIPLNVNANIFSSLIADLKDQKFINKKTTKVFCYSYIADSFSFNGTHNDKSYISNVMRPHGVGRVSYDKGLIPDIKLFKNR